MCFSNCPFESHDGECTNRSKQGTPLSHCREPEDEDEDDE